MDDRDYSYFQRRLEEERAAAERSPDPVVEFVHLRLAEQYETLLAEPVERQERDGVAAPHLMPVPPSRTM